MTRPKKVIEKVSEDTIQAAVKYYSAYLGTPEEVSIRKAAKYHGLNWERLRNRLAGSKSRQAEMESRQRLSPVEEQILVDWLLQLHRWGWPVSIP
jgi:hypothetical protein